MNAKIQHAVAEREPLAEDLAQHLERIGAVVAAYREQDPPDPAELAQNLAPLVPLAHALRDEYARYEETFTSLLDQLAALDTDALQTFPGGREHLVALPRRARDVRRAIAAALEDLDGVLAQINTFTQGARAEIQLTEIQSLVGRLTMDLYKLPSDLRFFLARMGNFESAQPAPPGVTITGPIIRM